MISRADASAPRVSLFKLHEFDRLLVRQLVFQVLHQIILGLLNGETGNTFQHFKLALLYRFRLGQPLVGLLVFVVEDFVLSL